MLTTGHRWFEALAPSGVLREGTDPVDGIFCGGNPEDFQGHEGIRYSGKHLEDVPYAKLGLDAQNGDLGFGFATNECEYKGPVKTWFALHIDSCQT